MSDSSMTPLQSDEALHAFMDGELSLANEQSLFDELAASPELRTEMKDALAIRGAVFQDIKSPPANGEAALLAGLGFPAGAGGAAGASTAAVGSAGVATAAGGGGSLISTIAMAMGSAGFVLAWLLLLGDGDRQNTNMADSSSNSATSGSGNVEAVAGRAPEAKSDATVPVRVDTVYAVKLVPIVQENRPIVQTEIATTETTVVANNETDVVSNETTVAPSQAFAVAPAQYRAPSDDALAPKATSSQDLRTAQYQVTNKGVGNAIFRFRTLASNLPSGEPTPESVQNAVLPNSAFALMFPIANGHELGAEIGSESFRQVFQVDEDGKTVEYTQTPVLFWIGATYQWTPVEFDFLPGLSPFVNMTAGYVDSQGPIGRGTVGLSYQPFGPIRFTAGVDASALMYTHNANSFITSKWGLSYGISLDLGSIR